MDIIVGTSGHIDHGKTALVKALTGTDADRFPEEKQRGITIDIGFAELDLGDLQIGFVDVPGHEKFVKNMLAGASGIDVVLLVVAADEGVMPQTREHFEICRLLETKTGLIVLTKKDLVDDEMLELVRMDVAELVDKSFLQNAPVIEVSARTGEGMEELKSALKGISKSIPARKNETVSRLPIDRSFTVKGFGAVVTGTLIAGHITESSEMEILPAHRNVRVRGIQTYGKSVGSAHVGQRTAVNLGGIDHSQIERGMVLAEKEALRPTQMFDAEVEVLKHSKKSLKSRQRVRVHIGTIEALARVEVLNDKGEIAPGELGFVQLRLESPVVCIPDERFILRQYSPEITIAGGHVIENSPIRHRRKDSVSVASFLEILSRAEKPERVKLLLETAREQGLSFSELRAKTGWKTDVLRFALTANVGKKSVVELDSRFIARTPFDRLKAKTVAVIEAFHQEEPLAKGISRETLRETLFSHLPAEIFKATLASLEIEEKVVSERDFVRTAEHNLELSADEEKLRGRLLAIYNDARLEVPKLDDALNEAAASVRMDQTHARKIFQLLLNSGEIVRITDEFYFAGTEIEGLKAKLKSFAEASVDKLIDVPRFKDIAGVSRKYAIPLLEYFDRERVTRRAGDKRLIL